jgi:hypothetical protein
MARQLPEFRLQLHPVTQDARKVLGFRWADPHVGNRHKLGGTPDFQQATTVPACPSCGGEMSFYAQLDSVGDTLVLADCGLVYVFVCFDCHESTAFIQSG